MQIGYPVYVNGTIDRDTVLRLNARLGLTLFWYKFFYFSYENFARGTLVRLQRFRIKNRKCCIKTRPTWPSITLTTQNRQFSYPAYVNGIYWPWYSLALECEAGADLVLIYKRFYSSYENLVGQILDRLQKFRKKNRKSYIKRRPTWPLITIHKSKLNFWT